MNRRSFIEASSVLAAVAPISPTTLFSATIPFALQNQQTLLLAIEDQILHSKAPGQLSRTQLYQSLFNPTEILENVPERQLTFINSSNQKIKITNTKEGVRLHIEAT